jgi:hypothetical protein
VRGEKKPEESEIYQDFRKLLFWADRVKRLKVRANTDTPADAKVAFAFGAEGIGLARTTVLSGGIPIMRRVTQKTTKESFQAEDFVRIFDRRSSDPRVEMFQNHVDYTFLGPELTPSTPANFTIVVTKLREWFPLAIFDERLTRRFKTDVPAAGPGEALEINCKLIYLCHLAIERRGC